MSRESEINRIKEQISFLSKKARISKSIFIITSIILILMAAFNGILSAYSIAKNPNLTAVRLFVAIAFLNAIIAFLASITSFFVFDNIYNKNSKKIEFLIEKRKELEKNANINLDDLVIQIANIKVDSE
ncbi:DUF4231 domain-containing protein [Mesomycoplasma hyorhinis]|uniref:DUF4231 domain-containing protein n=1 Tax=Mesomycoplasma hyorhinis TaxID=2100 RepID=UPI001C05C2CC|nr:DUF4231 domain-containing protein [Mesomycoplasma hyorhinis]